MSTSQAKRFIPAEGSSIRVVDAEVIGDRLTQLEQKSGEVTPEAVLADATRKTSPLHRFFEWDDTKAASAHRLDQARYLIRSIKVVITNEEGTAPTKIRAFVKVVTDTTQGFRGISSVMSDAEMRAQVIARAMKELGDWTERYRTFAEFGDVMKAAEKTKTKIEQKRAA